MILRVAEIAYVNVQSSHAMRTSDLAAASTARRFTTRTVVSMMASAVRRCSAPDSRRNTSPGR